MFKNKTILITGGTGSWGQELTRQALQYNPKEIRIFSRNEDLQVSMQRLFDDHRLKFIIGDVCNFYSLQNACRDVDYVFHLAALKHVTVCENQPDEAFKTNVLGTKNIIEASINCRVKKVINVSTDKAVDPINFYGMTKAYSEKMITQADCISTFTRFVCVRGGNVLGSSGSVVPYFKKQILEKQEVQLTSRSMTRFFLTIADTIKLLMEATQFSIGGEIVVFAMKSCNILSLANVLGNLLEKEIKINEIGVRQGEKFHEVLISALESPNTYIYKNNFFIILPQKPTPLQSKKYITNNKVSFESFISNNYLMSTAEIKNMLQAGGFLSN